MKSVTDQPLIYIVDDDLGFTVLLNKELKKCGYTNVRTFYTGKECVEAIKEKPDIVFLDYSLDVDFNGLEILKIIKKTNKDNYVIMLTAAEKIELAIDSLRLGAYDYIIKNENAFQKICNRIKKIIKEKQLSEKSR